MNAFTGSLRIEEIEPGRKWRLLEPIRYEAGGEGSGLWIEVPAGFETDGATIPRVLHLVLAVWGTYGRAAALHDYLYSLLHSGEWISHSAFAGFERWGGDASANFGPARAWADAEFYRAMLACGTSPLLAGVMWAAVRLFGGNALRRVARKAAARNRSL